MIYIFGIFFVKCNFRLLYNVMKTLQCELKFTDEALKAIAQKAMEKQTGARGLRSVVVSCNYLIECI